ncbi:ATP-binding protein [Chitinilyticum litopenaei]|uniref:ATP-binding protein n=1 Tax=Chitinilyticum litopenaei TaxID=1121276 RepID=UPI000423BA6E|nr:ATP-binding protein [Chitinilyticum litopenaei]
MMHLARTWSISRRLQWGALAVLLAFLFFAGLALQARYADQLQASRYARLQSEIYLLMAAAELDGQGRLQLPATLAEPLFALPDSGLYATIADAGGVRWRSPSALGRALPVLATQPTGDWRFDTVAAQGRAYQLAAYQVRWTIGGQARQLQFAVFEDAALFQRQVDDFRRSLWFWLGGAALVLLLAQSLLLRWGLAPLRQLVAELARIESGQQERLTGDYPAELAVLTRRLNALVEQERARQQRYRDALGDLAHSLKTPLAVMRNAAAEPDFRQRVGEQVARMDHIVQHQLARAAARGSQPLASALPLRPVIERVQAALARVHVERALQFEIICPQALSWPLDEGDAFELCGNLLDNAAKWARSRVLIRADIVGERELLLVISDDGPGFADLHTPLLRGVRADEQVPGQGIGLAVVADIVAAYGGRIVLEQGELGGAGVRISLPLSSLSA